MDLNTITEQDYLGAISALREYEDLSYIDNGSAFLISACEAYICNSKDIHAQKTLYDVLLERDFYFQVNALEPNKWTNPFDEIMLPTFA